MPPSPALRCSPGRELKVENNHKRGRSLESGLFFKAKDDDLVLFNDMQMKERDNFLLHSNEDFDDSLSKLRCFSDYKLGINIPVRGESSDLLTADGDKNDYDWLLTPPETPLFPSLDDEEPPPPNLATRGRPRSQPITISRSSMAEKSQRASRGSASPRRLSPSPRPGSSSLQSRGRPSSAPHSSPAPALRPTTPSRRPATPSRRPSTPPNNRPSTPTPRSSTPTLRRMSSGSIGQTSSSGRRGTSPIKGSRGSSASPKLRGWQSNIPGFSSDVPPNLRTSLSDRPTSYSRGSSPASRNGKESSSNFSRQSMSPTASRSASSTHSHDRGFSPHSKGSVASSGDDEVDSLHSVSMGISISPTARKNGVFVNNRALAFSKKPSRTPLSSSAPKRSFDSALKQMEHRKTPQNMFRPLMSSVPASTFYGGKANSMHRPIFSRNSSLTTSSNASSELGASFAHDTEGSEHDQADLPGEWEKVPNSSLQEDIFLFDKMEEIREDTSPEVCSEKPIEGHDEAKGIEVGNIESVFENTCIPGEETVSAISSEPPHVSYGHSKTDSCERMATCSICGESFQITESVAEGADVCRECAKKDELFSAALTKTSSLTEEENHYKIAHATDEPYGELQPETAMPELPQEATSSDVVCQHESNVEQGLGGPQENSSVQLVMVEKEETLSDKQLEVHQTKGSSQHDNSYKFQHSSSFSSNSSLKIDGPEGTGISVLLLKRSSSSKGPVVQGRVLSASNMLYAEPSYARENLNASKLSLSRNSSTASSSLDLGPSRQKEARVQRQLSNRKGDMDNLRHDLNAKQQSSFPSVSAICSNSPDALVQKAEREDKKDVFIGAPPCISLGETQSVTDEHCSSLPSSSIEAIHLEDHIYTESFRETDVSTSESSSQTNGVQFADSSTTDLQIDQGSISHDDAEFYQQNERSMTNVDIPFVVTSDIDGEGGDNISDTQLYKCSVAMLEAENHGDDLESSQVEGKASSNSNENMESSHLQSVSMTLEKDILLPLSESPSDNQAENIHEETTVTVEGPRGQVSRSLTLEEATDTILFCSSIIHDLAYKAAAIAIEKEQSSEPEVSQPTVTIVEKPVSDQKDQRRVHNKRTPKSSKIKKKKFEATDINMPSTEPGIDAKIEELSAFNTDLPRKVESTKPPKLESKCNCTVM